MGNRQFKNQSRHAYHNFGRNNIIRNRQMQVLKRGFGVRGISFVKLEL